MKIIFKCILFAVVLIFFNACDTEQLIAPNPNFELSFERSGLTNASVAVPFYVIHKGKADFLTLYDGTEGRVWGEAGAKGVDFNNADSLLVQYNVNGTYKMTVVATSTSNQGVDYQREVLTKEIKVIDQRNTISSFSIVLQGSSITGTITSNDEILFSVPDIVSSFVFKPVFSISSSTAKVFVNNIEQTSGVTEIDFTNPVVYTVKPASGIEKQYTVKFSTFAASSENFLTKFILGTTGGNGENGTIDNVNKIITLAANYGTNLSAVTLILESSYLSKITINDITYADRTKYNLTSTGTKPVKSIKVIAQNNSESVYSLNVTALDPVTEFTFMGLIPAPVGQIDNVAKTITVNVLKGTDITKLIAKWKGTVGAVKVGTTVQTNGASINDFSTSKTYTFYKGTTAGANYVVTVVEK